MTLSADAVTSVYPWAGGHVNHVSVRDNQQTVEAELTRLSDKGYIVKSDSWDALNAKFKDVLVSKFAANTKERADGISMLRLIVEMRRSGIKTSRSC